jgi:4-hydroxybenzoate polyprenyltransferase
MALLALLPVAVHLIWQAAAFKADGSNALDLFRSNRTAGLLMALGSIVIGASA